MPNKKSLIYQLGKILGFEEDYIAKLEEKYQNGNEDVRYEIMDILWKYFFKLYDKLTALKYAQFFKEVAQCKRKLSSTFYQEAQEEVKTYFQKILTGEIEDEEKIRQLRQKIAEFVKTN
ncbi:MAG: hypothetical protein ACK4FL_04210 [Microgenomates group bacterium]